MVLCYPVLGESLKAEPNKFGTLPRYFWNTLEAQITPGSADILQSQKPGVISVVRDIVSSHDRSSFKTSRQFKLSVPLLQHRGTARGGCIHITLPLPSLLYTSKYFGYRPWFTALQTNVIDLETARYRDAARHGNQRKIKCTFLLST